MVRQQQPFIKMIETVALIIPQLTKYILLIASLEGTHGIILDTGCSLFQTLAFKKDMILY